jgi:hypothetical protein
MPRRQSKDRQHDRMQGRVPSQGRSSTNSSSHLLEHRLGLCEFGGAEHLESLKAIPHSLPNRSAATNAAFIATSFLGEVREVALLTSMYGNIWDIGHGHTLLSCDTILPFLRR